MSTHTAAADTASRLDLPLVLRFLGRADVASGVLAVAAAGWFGDQFDIHAAVVGAAGALLVLVGIATLVRAERRPTATATIAVEAFSALAVLTLLLFAEPTALGRGLLAALALWCAGAASIVATLLARR